MSRSTKLKPEYIAKVKAASRRKFARQKDLAEETGISRATVSKFLNGQRIDRLNFIELAEKLDFEPQDIIQPEEEPNPLEAKSSDNFHWDKSPLPQTTPEREEELTVLKRWIFEESCQVLSIYGFGKIGKTNLVTKLYHEAKEQNHFEGGLWVNLENSGLTVEQLLERIVTTWPQASGILSEERLTDKISKLIDFLATHPYLIVITRIDALFQKGELFGRYQREYRDYEELFSQLQNCQHRSCWVITSRQLPYQILGSVGENPHGRAFHLTGLNQSEAVKLLQRKGLEGREGDLSQLAQVYMGHPWWLQQLPSNIHTSTVKQFLDRNVFAFNGTWSLLEEHFQILSPLEQSTLYWLAINREPVTDMFLYDEDMASEVGRKGRLMEALRSLRYSSLVYQRDHRWQLPEIVLQFMITKLMDKFYDGFIHGNVIELNPYPLIKVTGKEYITEKQIELVLIPLLNRLKDKFGGLGSLETWIKKLLQVCRQELTNQPGYGAGNLFNLLVHLKKQESQKRKPGLEDLDLSDLFLWQADLTAATLHNVNLSNANLAKSIVLASCAVLLSMAQSGDGKILAAGDTNGKVHVWAVAEDGKLKPHLIHHQHSHWVTTVSVSADGTLVASGGEDQFIHVWDVKENQAFPFRGSHSHRLRAVAFSPKDKNLLASAGDDGHVVLWNIRSRPSVARYVVKEDKIRALAFSSDGKFLMSAREKGHIAVHPINSGDNYEKFSQPKVFQDACQGQLQAIALSPDDETLATGGDDGYLRLWQVDTGKLLWRSELPHTDWIRSIAFSPDGKNIATGSEDFEIKIWDSARGRYLNTLSGHDGRVWAVVFDPDGEYLFSGSGDQRLKTWDVQTGNCLKTIEGYTLKVRSVAFSPDGKQLATASDDGIVRLWDLTSKECKNLSGHQSRVCSISFTTDGAYLASGSDDKTVKVWNVSKQKIYTTFSQHTSWVRAVACAPNRPLIASCGDDRDILLQEAENFQSQKFQLEHKDWIIGLAFAWDAEREKLLLASASDDKTVKIWDVDSGKCILTLEEHQEPVRAVALSPDGAWVVSGSNDKTVRLCKIETKKVPTSLGRARRCPYRLGACSSLPSPFSSTPTHCQRQL